MVRGCGRKVFWRGCDEGEHGNRLTQRQCFPRFGAGTVVQKASGHDGRKGMLTEVVNMIILLTCMPPKLSKNHTATALKDRSRHEKSTCESTQVLHSGLFKAVDPAGLEPATP